jgi:hypothetical protein
MHNSVVAEGSGRGRVGEAAVGVPRQLGRWVAWGGMRCERCAGWRGVRDSVLLRGGALGSLGEVAVGGRGKVLGAPRNWIQCGRAGVVLGGVECAALRVVCRERRGIMRMCCGQQRGCAQLYAGAGARGAGTTGEEALRRVVTPVQAGVGGVRWVVPGVQRLSWAAEARTAGGTWVITAH